MTGRPHPTSSREVDCFVVLPCKTIYETLWSLNKGMTESRPLALSQKTALYIPYKASNFWNLVDFRHLI